MSFLPTSETFISLTLLFFAYVFSITAAGVFQAYVTRSMGDSTADDVGLSEFNPFLHINPLSLIFFLLINFMAGQSIPIDVGNLKGRWYPLRLFWAFGSRSVFYLLLSVVSWVLSLVICGPITHMGEVMFPISIQMLAAQYAQGPRILMLFCLFLGFMTLANVLLAVFSAIQEAIYCFVMVKFHKDVNFIAYAEPILIFAPLVVIFLFGNVIFGFFLYGVGSAVLKIAALLGVL
jgi:hypothetical protein